MRRLSSMILLLWGVCSLIAQSPHGEELKLDCAECHNPEGWSVNYAEVSFDHDNTSFGLEGSHRETDCRMCHESMVFREAPSSCVSCHEDIHSMSVGDDCMRCHSPDSWLVDMIPELHEENGFPLIGAHANLSCVECHTSETNLRFDRIGNECIACHRQDYVATENPNHEAAGYSTECTECHNPLGFGWESDPIAHDFFPLVLGHNIQDCNACHTPGDFGGVTSDCFACHTEEYTQTSNPKHTDAGFSTDCKTCHSLEPGWMPANFDHDNRYFPIYSGKHKGEWNDCADCHNVAGNYAVFTCFTCHSRNETADEHDDVNGYVYESNACLSCHPDGEE